MSKILYILKIAFVTAFVSLLYFVIDYFLSIVLANFNLDLLELPCYLGVFQALNLLISIAITSYIPNQLISYFRG